MNTSSATPRPVSPLQLPPIPLIAPTAAAATPPLAAPHVEAVPEPPPRPSFPGAKPVLAPTKPRASGAKGGKGEEEEGKQKPQDAGWELDRDMAETLRRTFWLMDDNKSGWLDEKERHDKKPELTAFMEEHGVPVDAFDGKGHISFNEFREPFAREWEVRTKQQALPGDRILRCLAEELQGGSSKAPLGHLEAMTDQEIGEYCSSSLAPALARALAAEVGRLRERRGEEEEGAGGDGTQANGKFATSVFGPLDEFRQGIAGRIGLPNPK